MISKNHSFKYFEFTNNHFKKPRILGPFDLYQVCELELSENAYIDEHRQLCCEISYILSGEGTFSTGNTEMHVSAGDIHIIPTDAYHAIRTGRNRSIRFACIGFMFNSDFPHDTLGSIPALFDSCPEKIVHDNGEIGRLFSMLIDENYNGAKNSKTVCESLINCILIKTERLFCGIGQNKFLPERSKDFIGQPLYDIIRFIDKSVPECPSVSELCASFNYSESYISHLFKGRLGISLREYITDSKLKYAEALLLEEKQSITEIANILGYGSSQSFCKAFRKKYGASPTSYRQAAKKQIGTHTLTKQAIAYGNESII